MGAIDAQLGKLLPSCFVCLVQHRTGKTLSLETSLTITLRLTNVQNTYVFHESTPVEQGQGFATSTETLDPEEMSELSDTSTENVANTRSPRDNTREGETGNFLIFFRKSAGFRERTFSETSFYLPWERVQAMKQTPRKKKRTMTGKMTLDFKSTSISRLRSMTHIPIGRLVPWTNLV